ncbi:hypothetical protein NC653_034502 [Populus alba x Populus x berolinensis]|uniref:Uncharacterized protein n=1 Tax=Populus alba x Populus x berolinensis TaxID=444605 RepID=A0AAD6LMQ4_9ROSI|nr:hypothetical protein NC653_034502 [Populus alba x Populus x berolinensis]
MNSIAAVEANSEMNSIAAVEANSEMNSIVAVEANSKMNFIAAVEALKMEKVEWERNNRSPFLLDSPPTRISIVSRGSTISETRSGGLF